MTVSQFPFSETLPQGVISFVARADVSDLEAAPRGELLWGVGRAAVISSDGRGT